MKIRIKGLKVRKSIDKARYWIEKDFIDKEVKSGVIILPTIGCRHARNIGCTMCGYIYDAPEKISNEKLVKEFEKALEYFKSKEIEYLKIFTSGSFLDDEELKPEIRKYILRRVEELNIRRLCIETRAEFIKEPDVDTSYEIEYAIGLESSNDVVRNVYINKDLDKEVFENAIRFCKENGIKTKVYLLLKPPFLTEMDAIKDCINSAIYCKKLGVDKISINPVNIQRNTLVEYLWKIGEYSPPWLWSLVHVLKEIKRRNNIVVVSFPVAAGKERGIHNCKRCNKVVHESIIKFSLSQDTKFLEGLDCCCKRLWKTLLDLENVNRSCYNIDRNCKLS